MRFAEPMNFLILVGVVAIARVLRAGNKDEE